jgi:DNA-binding XRE family transcriptional regulator
MRNIYWNDKVSKKRGSEWKKKLVEGRLDAAMNPTKLKLARVKAGFSQEEVAKRAGLSLGTYGAIERSKRSIKYEPAKRISKILKISLESIFKEHSKGKLISYR